MSQYYKPNRNPDWNYGGKQWKLSRSKIDLFLNCPRCFYIDNKLGVARPPGYPFSLNSAVDTLLKKEFDIHRVAQTQHPLLKSYGLDAVPFLDPRMDEWRDSLKRGIRYHHKETGLLVSGGVDDVWVTPKKELLIVDYKATAKKEEVSLDAEWQIGYKRQMEVYQWLFRKNDFQVSNTGYFVYVNGKTDKEAFDAKLEFDVSLLPYTGDASWVEGTLRDIQACLESGEIPAAADDCDYCRYREAAGVALQKIHPATLKEKPQALTNKKIARRDNKQDDEKPKTEQLF